MRKIMGKKFPPSDVYNKRMVLILRAANLGSLKICGDGVCIVFSEMIGAIVAGEKGML